MVMLVKDRQHLRRFPLPEPLSEDRAPTFHRFANALGGHWRPAVSHRMQSPAGVVPASLTLHQFNDHRWREKNRRNALARKQLERLFRIEARLYMLARATHQVREYHRARRMRH